MRTLILDCGIGPMFGWFQTGKILCFVPLQPWVQRRKARQQQSFQMGGQTSMLFCPTTLPKLPLPAVVPAHPHRQGFCCVVVVGGKTPLEPVAYRHEVGGGLAYSPLPPYFGCVRPRLRFVKAHGDEEVKCDNDVS